MAPQDLAACLAAAGARLSLDHVAALQRVATERPVAAGEVLLREGESSSTLYIVADGELAISGAGTELGRCGAGAILGEVSFLDRGLATATVTATRASNVYSLDRAGLDVLYRDTPHAATALLQTLCVRLAERVRTSSDKLESFSPESEAQPATTRTSLLAVLRGLFFRQEPASETPEDPR